MTTMTARPTFLQSLLDSWQLSVSVGRKRDLIPYWIAIALTLGATAAFNLPDAFWDRSKPEAPVAALAGLLTFNGIVLALCWSAFAKVYEIIGAGAFCAHLRKHKLLNHYLLFVGYCHSAQVLAITCTAFALAALWLPFDLLFVKLVVGSAMATSIYAVRQGVATSSVMQDLIWRKSAFDQTAPQETIKPVESATL